MDSYVQVYINYRGISLLSVPSKIYGRILNERMMKVTDKSVGDRTEP